MLFYSPLSLLPIMKEMIIRHYQPGDREAIFQIACDTAFFGDPVEAYLEDRRLFFDAFYRYYTNYEPQHAWVVDEGERAIGFLMGCTNSQRHDRLMALWMLPGTLLRSLLGRYRFGPRTWTYLKALVKAGRQGEFPEAAYQDYPAHLHINIEQGWRGYGLGRKLIQAYLDQLKTEGINGVHLNTTDRNVAACKLYESMGFHLLDARKTELWSFLFPEPVENRLYGKEL